MNILGIIPARAGSKRIPDKNLQLLGEKPLIARSIEAALGSRLLHKIVISSDSERVLEIARQYSGLVALKRPVQFSDDHSPAIEYVQHALEQMRTRDQQKFDMVVIIQPSSPLTLSEDIDRTIDKLIKTGADTVVSVVELGHAIHPLKMKRMEGDKLVPYVEEEAGRMTAHEMPKIYVRNCSVYATRTSVIDQGLIIGNDCRGYIMPPERSVDINEPLDLEFARFLFSRLG